MNSSDQNLALVGAPNSGKTTLFNTLTGSKAKTANRPGVTVEQHYGRVKTQIISKPTTVFDLPGIYNLGCRQSEERITRDFLLGHDSFFIDSTKDNSHHDIPSRVLLVIDATKLEKSLYLACELKELGIPFITVLSKCDKKSNQSKSIDTSKLSQLLNSPVLEVCSFDERSLQQLDQMLGDTSGNLLKEEKNLSKKLNEEINQSDWVARIYQNVDHVLSQVSRSEFKQASASQSSAKLSARLDRFLTHPFLGPVFLILLMTLIFESLFSWAGPFQDMIEESFGWLADHFSAFATSIDLSETFVSLVNDGVLAGVGGTLVFLPQILILFFFIGLMEETGYMARASYILDAPLRFFGLPGKAAVPFLSSHACAIPGIMAARTLRRERDRLAVILSAPLTICSARLPVFAMLLAALFPNDNKWGVFSAASLVLFLLYATGLFSALVVSLIVKKANTQGQTMDTVFELPNYQVPNFKKILHSLWDKGLLFVRKAGTVILLLTIFLWALTYFPRQEDGSPAPVNESYNARVSQTIAPVFKPLGFDWQMTAALIPSFAAREVMVSSLATVLSVENTALEEVDDENFLPLSQLIANKYSIATLIALLIWFIYAPQCISTFAVIKRETNGYRWATISFLYSLGLAYLLSWLGFTFASSVL